MRSGIKVTRLKSTRIARRNSWCCLRCVIIIIDRADADGASSFRVVAVASKSLSLFYSEDESNFFRYGQKKSLILLTYVLIV